MLTEGNDAGDLRHPPGLPVTAAGDLSGRLRSMAQAVGLDHIVLVVGDVERSLDWYQQHLGLGGVRIEEWRRGEAPFPSLRVTESTIIDLVPGEHTERGHLDHICFVVSRDDLDSLSADPALTIIDEGPRYGAQGDGQSIYVKDPDDLTVEIRAY